MADIKTLQDTKSEHLALSILVLLFAVLLIRTAWICDDAYISFRVVYNWLHGYGLTWNVSERVQVYTNPLWLLLIAPVYWLLGDIYYTSHLVSILVSLAAVYLLLFRLSRSFAASILAALVLLFSNAFVDYSTSGLENPLTHLLLVIFFYLVFRQESHSPKILFLISLVASLALVNRMDTILLTGPTLIWLFLKNASLRTTLLMAAGMVPFLCWEIFALIYYGFLLPNTAYAKLNTGIWKVPILIEGVRYLLDSISNDPITLFTIALTMLLAWWQRTWRLTPLFVGVLLYIAYTVKVGGDFMGGRFLSAPLLCSVIALTQLEVPDLRQNPAGWIMTAALLVLGFASPFPTLLSNAAYGHFPPHIAVLAGLNTRSHYYRQTGLLRLQRDWTRGKPHPAFIHGDYQPLARSCRGEKTPIVHGGMGLLGFDAGPKCYIIDALALTDPFLSKLPAIQSDWRPGHYRRKLPRGYLASLREGKNLIQDEHLARLYDQIRTVTRGKLFSAKRWRTIVGLNLGSYRKLVATSKEMAYPETRIRLEELAEIKPEGTPYYAANENFTTDQLVILLNGKQRGWHHIDLSIDHKQDYRLSFHLGGRSLDSIDIPAAPGPAGGLKRHLLPIPEAVSKIGFDRIVLKAIHNRQDNKAKWVRFYSIGHFRLI